MSTDAVLAPRADACPDAEQLAAYLDGTLPAAERTVLERHLVGCVECRDIVGDGIGEVVEVRPLVAARRSRATWVGVGAVLAAAAAVVLVMRVDRATVDWRPLLPGPSAARPFAARISVMTEYAPAVSATRGAESAQTLTVDARLAAAELEKRAEERQSGETLHDAGVARLLTGNAIGAIELLQKAASVAPTAPILSDLAAALLVDGSNRNDKAQIERARAAAIQALAIDAAFRPALFNAALIAERDGTPDAAGAWRRYLQVDQSSGWADEARSHLAQPGVSLR